MRKATIVVGVLGLLVASIFVCLPMNAKAMGERNWITLGKDYVISGDTSGSNGNFFGLGYIRVNSSDTVNITWKSGSVQFDMRVDTNMLAVSSYVGEGGGYGNYKFSYRGTFSGSPIQSYTWLKCSSGDILYIEYQIIGVYSETINITITPDPINNSDAKIKTLEDEIKLLEERCTYLNTTLTQINASLKSNGAADKWLFDNVVAQYYMILDLQNYTYHINNNFNESMKENLSTLRTEFYDNLINLSIYESNDITRIHNQIELLNSTINYLQTLIIADNDTNITNKLDDLSTLISIINGTLNDRISNIPQYNDTFIWDEMDILKQVQPMVLINNTTLVNQTIVEQTLLNQTLVNQTLVNETPVSYVNRTQQSTVDITPAVVGAVVAGVTSGTGTAVVMGRRKQELLP
jgi:hypothetical protein